MMKIGIIGCGAIGAKRAAAAHGHEIAVVNDIDVNRANALAQKYGARAVPNWSDVLCFGVDTVIIATTHDSLAQIALEAVKTGHHVLVEKPVGRSQSELLPILAAAKATGRCVKVGFNHRFHPAVRKAKILVESEEFGPIMYIRGRYGHGGRLGMETEWRCDPEISGGGELIDQAPHLIDLSRWFMGDLTLDYSFTPTFFWNIKTEDNAFLCLRSPANQIAWLHASWTEWKNMFSFEIYTRDAKLIVEGLGGSYGTEKLTLHRMLPQMGPPETTVWEYPFPDNSWRDEFEDLASAIQAGRRPNGDLIDAYAMLAIVDKARGKR